MSITNVAIIGATGNVGSPILKALLDANLNVTILTREGSKSTDGLPAHPNQQIKKVDMSSTSALTEVLKSQNIQAIACNVATAQLSTQKGYIDAAIAAGVQRFIPSAFGADLEASANQSVPLNMPKVDVENYLHAKAKENPNFSYTTIACGPFLDWGLAFAIYGDLKTHTATLWDGGNTKFSTTSLPSVGAAVVGVLKNPEATRNKYLRIADTTVTQRELLDIVKSVDGVEWTTTQGDTASTYQAGLAEFQKPEPNFMFGIMAQLYRMIFGEGFATDWSDKMDNEVVGLPKNGLTQEEVKEVVKGVLESTK